MRRTLLIALAIPALVFGKMAAPSIVPVDRLIQNAEINLKKNPGDADVVFILARLHSLGYAAKSKDASIYWSERGPEGSNQNGRFQFAPWVTIQQESNKAVKLGAKELEHLKYSFILYGRAVKLQPENGMAKLGRAWVSEEAGKHISQTAGFVEGKKLTQSDYRAMAAGHYRELVAEYKSKPNEHRWGHGEEDPGYEAAENLLRLFKEGVSAKPGEPAALKNLMADYEKRPIVMSPIIFPVNGAAPSALTSATQTTSFDIAADGLGRRWEWITPEAAFLAWDPAGTGKISNGEQLFGNRTFNMFFRDGYAALAILDDNLDGWLTQKEMKGIVVWHDRNSNGLSDNGEVTSIESWGVEAIRVKSNGMVGNMTSASVGMKFRGGRTTPTYDWWPSSKNR